MWGKGVENLGGGRSSRKGMLEKAEICELSVPNFILQSPGPCHATLPSWLLSLITSQEVLVPNITTVWSWGPCYSNTWTFRNTVETVHTSISGSPAYAARACIFREGSERNSASLSVPFSLFPLRTGHLIQEQGHEARAYKWLPVFWNLIFSRVDYPRKRIKCQPTCSLSSSSLHFHWKSYMIILC